MTGRLARLWRGHRLLVIAFLLAAVVTGAFAVRSVVFWLRWSDPALRTVPLEGWMTPGWIAHARGAPVDLVLAAIELDQTAARGRTLAELAVATGRPLPDLVAAIEAALAAQRAGGGG